MAIATLLPSGAWRCRPTKVIDGKKVTKSFTVHPNECAGNSKKAKKKAELLADQWQFEAKEEQSGVITVEKAIDDYVESRDGVISPSTIKDYYNMKKYFTSILNVEINDVTNKMIQNIIGEMAVSKNRYGKCLNERTIKNRIFFLLAALKFSHCYTHFDLRFTESEQNEYNPPQHNEFDRLIAVCENNEDKLILMLCGLYTLRRGELCGLTGKDILWDMHSIYVHTSLVQNKNHEWVLKPTPKKKQSIRTIEIEPEFMVLIPHVGPDEHIISLNPNQVTKRFEKLRKKAWVDCRLHDLRKYAASIRSDLMPRKYVESDGGWKIGGNNVLKTHYDKPFIDERKRYSKKFNELAKKDYGEALLG